MAKTQSSEPVLRGTDAEQKVFSDVRDHYKIAKEDLEQRVYRRNGFDDADKFFASYIDENKWPYRSLIFDARPWTVILEKSARLVGSKPKGRLVPREGGDALGAYVNNELLSFQWDDNSRLGESMISKWIMMDQNARKYGASFGMVKYRCEYKVEKEKDKKGKVTGKRKVFYEGPDFVVCNPRDVLANPSYSTIKNWFQYREYVTISELQNTNDTAKGMPVYKNIDLLRDAEREMAKGKGDRRDTELLAKNKAIRGLTDYLGQDETFKTIEIVTEYRPDRWITFAPRHGVVIRDILNPYKHGEIPVVMLKYYPLPDDLYGVSEFEPVASQIRAINAHTSAFSDSIALTLRPPVHVNPINVRMHTIEWAPEAKWLMNNPNQDVQQMRMDTASITTSFQSVYSVMVSSLLNAWGEASQGTSQIDPFQAEKTATEVRDSAFTRNVRDNMNQIFLSEALKKQIMYWHSMNQQFMFQGSKEQAKIIRIVGRDAVEFFTRQGLSDIRPTEEDTMMVASGQLDLNQVNPGPRFAVDLGDGTEVPKFQPDDMGSGGTLIIEPGDVAGNYDYIADIETMKAPSQQDIEQKLTMMLGTATNPAINQMLAAEGKKLKITDLLVKMFESTNVIKDAEAYFEDLPPQQPVMPGQPQDVQQPNATGTGEPAGMPPSQRNGVNAGMGAAAPVAAI